MTGERWLMNPHLRRGWAEWWILLAAMLAVAGCTPQLYGYDKIRDSDGYIPPSMLKNIVEQRSTRAEVIQRLGEPDGINEERHTIGYDRTLVEI